MKNSGANKFGKSGRDTAGRATSPGPGAYEDRLAYERATSSKGGIKFGKSEKKAIGDDLPGPELTTRTTFQENHQAVESGTKRSEPEPTETSSQVQELTTTRTTSSTPTSTPSARRRGTRA
jgi:hypothetical protein